MHVQIKFCGLTRPEDVAEAARLGAEYTGVVFAGGPRSRSVEHARTMFTGVAGPRRVGVFGEVTEMALRSAVGTTPLDVVQLHGDTSAAAIALSRASGATAVWAVVAITGRELPPGAEQLFLSADAVVLDTGGANGSGGTGRVFDWVAIAERLAGIERRGMLVLAGGLGPHNVARAISAIRPDVVDVSSGVESAPGIKDHQLMRRFADAARGA